MRHVDTILAGRIRLPGNEPWREDFVAESVAFPYGDYTDQVDAMTQYLDFMEPNPVLKAPSPRPGGVIAGSRGVFTAESLAFARFGPKRS